MGLYIIRRFVRALITLAGVSLLTFWLIFAPPGDIAETLAGERAQAVSIEALRKQLGLDQPIHVQYVRYMANLLRGDLGDSYYFRRPVSEALFAQFPATAQLAVAVMLLALLFGIPVGTLAALKSNTLVDRALMITGLLTISTPTFFLGLLMIYFLAFRLDLFPVGGYGGFRHLVLPALTVALPWSTWYAVVLRSNMLDVISTDYARTAYAKGLNPWAVARRHLLPNAVLPLVTMLGMDMANLLTGLALVEYVFSWPGIGWQALQAARQFDVPMIMGSVLFGALLLNVANIVVDVLYAVLDPRVRLT